jgi:penicillin-binding protein 1A
MHYRRFICLIFNLIAAVICSSSGYRLTCFSCLLALFQEVTGLVQLKKLPTRNALYRKIWTADSYVSSGLFETWDFMRRVGAGYSSFLYRWFRVSGPKRFLIDVIDDFFTFGVAAVFAIMAYALPPFSGTGDIWNRGREYAITFTDSAGQIIGQRGIRQNDAVPLDEIPAILVHAVLATEDARFYDHFGVDVIGTIRAVVRNARANGVKQGGSSITQQVAKNLFLSPEKTIRRKVNEAFLSMWIEARLSKQEILKLYLDRSYLGGGNYGVEAAAQFYFGKSVRDINISEAAVLAGLFKAPTNYAPHKNPEASAARTNVVLFRMLDAGFINQGELLQARRKPAQIVQQSTITGPDWFMDYAYQDTLDIMEKQGLKGDYVVEVKTTINSKLQEASQAILNDVIDNQGPIGKFTQAASITMSPDGAVRAVIGGRDYEDSQFNRAITARRQVGSAFKPFVYLAALEHGYTRDTKVEDSEACVGNWCVHNYNAESFGNTPLWNAMAHSINTIAVKLMKEVGRKTVEATARRMGITGPIDPYPTMAIGTSALTLIDMNTGYATLAAGGKLAHPYAVLEIHKPNGDLLYSHAANEKDPPQVAAFDKVAELNSMMHDVVMSGTAKRAQLGYEPVAGKTGTNANYRDAWFFGFTAHHVTGVWVGNDDNTPMDGTKENAVTGGRVPAPAWKRIMDVAEAGLPPEGIPGAPMDGTYKPAETTPVIVDAALTADEAPAPDLVLPEGQDAYTKDVLNSMFDLFQTNVETPLPVRKTPKPLVIKTPKQSPLVLPKPNTTVKKRDNFIQRLFGIKKKKPKTNVPRTIFGF